MTDVSVVDVFCYNGDPIVVNRMKYLDAHVDTFVIVESWYTFSGTKKDELFIHRNHDIFKPYISKIQFIIVESCPPVPDNWVYASNEWVQGDTVEAWWREYHQRQSSLQYLKLLALQGKVIAVNCDADEIPSIAALELLRTKYDELSKRPPIHLSMSLHYYSWDWYNPEEAWHRAFAITSDHILASPGLSDIRTSMPTLVLEDGAGWHCSYFMDSQGVRDKIQAFSHREFDIPEFTSDSHIKECMRSGKDLFKRGPDLVRTPSHIMDAIPFN